MVVDIAQVQATPDMSRIEERVAAKHRLNRIHPDFAYLSVQDKRKHFKRHLNGIEALGLNL